MSVFNKAEHIFPIYKVEHDCMVSMQGDLTVAYRLQLPDIFSLSEEEYEVYHQSWIRAIKVMPKNSIVHKQDVFMRDFYRGADGVAPNFLTNSADRHFKGRPFLAHTAYLMLTQKASDRKPASSAFSGIMRRSVTPKQTTDGRMLPDFLEKTGQFERILTDSGLIRLTKLTDDELCGTAERPGLLEQYCFLLRPDSRPLLKDIHLKDRIQIGDQHGQLFTLSDCEDLPGLCGSRLTYEKYSTDKTKFPIGFVSQLNLLLPCDHIYNQYIFIGDTNKTLKQLESKKLRLQSLSAYSRENAISRDATNDFLNEAISQQRLPVKAHFNVFAWTSVYVMEMLTTLFRAKLTTGLADFWVAANAVKACTKIVI